MLAAQYGFRNWNTLRAAASAPSGQAPWTVGGPVKGRYLGQAFTGKLIGVRSLGGGARYKLIIDFDQPVDVVRFDSFSAPRKRVEYLVDREGRSWEKTSDGQPHLVIEAA